MPRELTVGSDTFQYPEVGDRSWGEDATNWAEAISETVNTLTPAGFIAVTTVNINDNVSTFTDILGAAFNSSAVHSFRFHFTVERTNGVTRSVEIGSITGVFSNSDWDYSIRIDAGDAGMDYQVTSAGQIQYKSSSIGGTYNGTITFYANVTTS